MMMIMSVITSERGSASTCRSKKLLEETFAKFDMDSNGFLTLDEASNILREDPFLFPPDKVLHLLKRFDKDGNGKLDYREFAGFYAEAKARYM